MDSKSHQSVRTYFLIIGVLMSVVLYLTYERILFLVGDFLVVKDDLEPADLIHVIAGDDHRTDYAIHVYNQGYGRLLFFTGGWCTNHHSYHGERGREAALERGVPPEAVSVDESQVSSTFSEALRLKEFIGKIDEPIRSIIVLSDPHHMRRTRWAYKKVFGEQIKIAMAAVPFELSPYKRQWWEDEGSRRMVREEYIKMLYYYARYQFSKGRLKEWLASLDRE